MCYLWQKNPICARFEKNTTPSKKLSHLLERVAVRLRNGIAIAAAVLAIVGAVRWSPGLVVHGAVETLGNAVLRENVGIEKYLEDCQP